MARWFAVIVLLASGCRSLLGLSDSTPRDGGDDDGARLVDAPLCWGHEPRVCLAAEPTMPVTLQGILITDRSSACVDYTSGPAGLCVIAATTVDVTAVAALQGTKPVVVIAVDTLTISNLLDAGSHTTLVARVAGAGASAQACMMGMSPTPIAGGAGGSFVGAGGAGGGNTDINKDPSGTGGMPGATTTDPTELRAGCTGQNGGSANSMWGVGGYGGGAIELVAGGLIDIEAKLDASGGGGVAGLCTEPGGGDCDGSGNETVMGAAGGGSGGMIVLDAPAITVAADVFADGGGGGEGASHGRNGNDGGEAMGDAPAPGGTHDDTSTRAGVGGAGSHAGMLDGMVALPGTTGSSAVGTGGAGGGGGGAGAIHVYGTPAFGGAGTVSPAPKFR